MKKTICFLFCLFALFSMSVSATDITEIIPSELKDEFKTYSAQTNEPESMLELFSFNNVLALLKRSAQKAIPEVTEFLSSILIVVILFGFLEQFSLDTVGNGFRVALVGLANAALLMLLYRQFATACLMVTENLETIRVFCDASIPIITALLISGGKTFGATLFSYAVSLSSALIPSLSSSICLPLIRIYLSLGCCGSIWEDLSFSSLTALIKKAIKWLIGIVFSVFSFSLSVQNVISRTSDNITQKTLKTAAGTIPFVGTMLAEGIGGTYTLINGTKTTSSLIGIAVIVSVFAGPAIIIGLQTFMMYVAVTFTDLFNIKSCKSVLHTVLGAYELLFGLFMVSVLMSVICFLVICIGAN